MGTSSRVGPPCSTQGVISGLKTSTVFSANDVRFAAIFSDIAGHISTILTSRVIVTHNIRFDLGFLAAEYARLGHAVPATVDHGLCTMELASTYLPRTGRSLVDCCTAAGVPARSWHSARADALATAQLLSYYLSHHNRRDGSCPLGGVPTAWPALPMAEIEPVKRGVADKAQPHFLARISEHLPRHPEVDNGDVYLQMLNRALLDRHISITESDALVELATDLNSRDRRSTRCIVPIFSILLGPHWPMAL